MNAVSQYLVLSALVVSLFAATSSSCWAYIDASTGSYLLQVIAAGIFASIFIIRGFWSKIKSSFARLFSKKRQQS